MTNKEIITDFYKAFQQLDAEKMVSHYDEHVTFSDPAFGTLHGDHAKNMWRMLVESQKGKNFIVRFSNIHEQDDTVLADWEAEYTFSQTGRKIHNIINAKFTLKEGKIITHHDHFNLHQWAKQALGFKGFLIGNTAFFKKKLQGQTKNLLYKWESKNNS